LGIDYDSVFVPIAYHTWYPFPDDPFYLYNPNEIRDRIGYYGNQQVPQFFLDGAMDCGNAPELWPPLLQERIQVSSPLQMSIAGYYDPDSLAGDFTVIVYAEEDPVALNLWLRIALIESDIYWQAPNGANIHNYIFRDMIPSTDGQSVEIDPGETKHFTYSFDIPSPLDATNCMLVAFIQSDQDRQILQGVKIGIPDLNSTTDLIPHPETPSVFHLDQNYPNPFNSETSIRFHTTTGFVELAVFDITGSLVNKIFEGNLDSGSYSMVWDGKDRFGLPVSSGIYYYRVTNDNRSMIKKLTILK
jgi:hypothetical protein